MAKGEKDMNNVSKIDMVKKRMTVTIDPKAISRLASISKEHNRNKSNMIETLIYLAYENKDFVKQMMIRKELDEM